MIRLTDILKEAKPSAIGNMNAVGASQVLGKGGKVMGYVPDTPNVIATLIQDYPKAQEIKFKMPFSFGGKTYKSIKKGDAVWKQLEDRYVDTPTKNVLKRDFQLTESLKEAKLQYDNWVVPSKSVLSREYDIEHERKGRDWWESEKEFMKSIKNAKPTTITKSFDNKIGGRSQTVSKDELLDLIRGYASYPKYRNAKTLGNIYKAFKENEKMEMPIVVKDGNDYEVMAGNTRMDIAFQLGINPKVLIVSV